MIFSILWSVFIYLSVNKGGKIYKSLCSASLIVVAICSILLLAGTTTDHVAPAYVIAGIILFSTVTVLSDAVGWNARFLQK